jgi:hypothetical protein
MVRGDDSGVPVAMRSVYRRLQKWRSKRKGRAPIPESLWIAAGELAREHGVNPVSRALGLEFNRLRQMAEAGSPPGSRKRKLPVFVEVIASPEAVAPQCAVELEGKHGKLRIEWRGTASELASFSRMLWEMIA